MLDWYTLAIIALFSYSIQNFLYKVSAEKRCNSAWTTFSFMATVAVLSSILFFVLKEQVLNLSFLLLIALLNAIVFLIVTLSRIEALKNLDASIVFPVTRLSIVFVVIFSLIYFKETLSIYQTLGIVLAILAIFILTKQNHEQRKLQKNFRLGLILTFVALISATISTIITKFAAINVNILGFISVSYIFNSFFAFSLRKKLQTKRANPKHKNAIIIGFFIGIANFIGFYFALKALSKGPLSVIAPITSLYFVIATVLAVLVYKEKMTMNKVIGILLAILVVFLMRF